MAYNKLIDLNLLSNFLNKIKNLIPTKTSDLENDNGYINKITSSDVTTALGYTPSSKDTTYSAGNGIDITNTIIKNTQGIEYIIGTQITSTAAWTGNSTDEALYTGKIIAYYLPFAGTSTAATLTLTMKNGATTEAIRLLRVGGNTITTQFAANNVIILIYDGTYWRVSAYYDSDTNTVPTGYCATAASTAAKSATCTYGYRDDTNYFPCLFRYANTAANATLAIASYATTALPIYVNGERTSATNTFGRGVILFLYYDKAYYCYNDGRLPILVDGVVTSVQDYTNELKNTIDEVSQVITSTNIDSTSVATFDASAAGMPLKGLTIDIEPMQDLHGYDHPWPAGGGKNLWNPEWMINGYISSTSYSIISDSVAKTVYVPVEEGETYTVSKTGGTRFRYAFASEEPKVTTQCSGFGQNDAAASITITAPAGATYLAVYVVGMSDNDAQTILTSVQIELGSTATAYSPYSNTCPITGWTKCNIVASKNIFDIDNATWVHGYLIAADGTISTNNSYKYCANFTPIIGGRKITVSGTRTSGAAAFGVPLSFYDDQKEFLSRISTFPTDGVGGYVQVTVDVPEGAVYFRLNMYDVSVPVSDFQIEYGDSATDFSPFQSFEITFPAEAGTVYGGTLDVVNKKLIVDKVEHIFTGAETFKTDVIQGIGYITDPQGAHNGTGGSTTVPFLICSHLNPSLSYLNSSNIDRTNKVWPWFNNSKLYISLGYTSGVTSAAEYINYLQQQYAAGTPVTVCYSLNDTIAYNLTTDQITTLLGTNNIQADCGDVTVTYGAYLETVKTYVDQSIANQNLIDNAQDERIGNLEQTTTATTINPSAIATFEANAANMPLKNLTVDIEPVQDFNGYDSPWPGGSRKNLLNIDDLITAPSGTFDNYTFKHKLTLIVLPNTQYTLSTSYDGTGNVLYFNGTSGSGHCVKADAPKTMQSSETGELTILLYNRDGISSFENKTVTVQLEEGSTATTYEPYSNICPVTGWTGCNINANGKNFMQVTLATMKRLNTSGVWADNKYTYNGITFTVDTDNNGCVTVITANGTASGEANLNLNGIPSQLAPLPINTRCIISGCPDGGSGDTYRLIVYLFHDNTYLNRMGQDIGNGTLFGSANANNYYARINIKSGVTASNLVFTPMIQLATDSSQAFEPYQGDAYNITFPTETGTVYGGTLNVTTGTLEVKYIKFTLTPDLQYANNSDRANAFSVYVLLPYHAKGQFNMYCNYLKVQENARDAVVPATQIASSLWAAIIAFPKTIVSSYDDIRTKITELYNSGTPIEIIYQIDQPIIYQLTPQQVTTLLGTNNIWADAGDVTVTYGVYLETIKSYADQLNNNIPNTGNINNTGLISIKHDSTELFTIQLPLYNGGVSNGT